MHSNKPSGIEVEQENDSEVKYERVPLSTTTSSNSGG